ncbi:MAG: radical SAM protein [Polyangiaceae bacterium]
MGKHRLSVDNHDRDAQGLRYVYAVASRRAGGVSLGINLNPNRACNWRCIYCQVPDLTRGLGPIIDLERLERELAGLLDDVREGRFQAANAPESRELKDVAFSGDGEPTSSPSFGEAVQLVGRVLEARQLLGELPITLITNGSMMSKAPVLDALAELAAMGGRVWFKLDAGTSAGAERINGQPLDLDAHVRRAIKASAICPTFIQTCMVGLDGEPPPEDEIDAYLQRLRELAAAPTPPRGVLLYTLARPSHQPEAPRLSALPRDWLEGLGRRIDATGLPATLA